MRIIIQCVLFSILHFDLFRLLTRFSFSTEQLKTTRKIVTGFNEANQINLTWVEMRTCVTDELDFIQMMAMSGSSAL